MVLARRKTRAPEYAHCANPYCYNFFTITKNRKKFCGRGCQKVVAVYKRNLAGAKASAAKTRGSNPDRHISSKRPDGTRILLHRLIYEQYIGRELLPYPDEIVHHKDRDKHHNCVPGNITCGSLFCEGNLELLSGDAAAEHLRLHYAEMYYGKYGRPYDPEREFTPEEIERAEVFGKSLAEGCPF